MRATCFGSAMQIVDCRQNPNLFGTVLRGNPFASFEFVLGLVHGG